MKYDDFSQEEIRKRLKDIEDQLSHEQTETLHYLTDHMQGCIMKYLMLTEKDDMRGRYVGLMTMIFFLIDKGILKRGDQ